jgi:hypothetical protein
MDPVAAVQSLRKADDPHRAVGLAHAVLNSEPSHELLSLAAEIADQDLDDPLEACSLLDQAADLTPRDPEADVERLRVISSLWPFGQPPRKAAFSPYSRGQLYKTAQDAFSHLPSSLKREHAHEVALCLIRVGQLEEAHEFSYRWLHDGQTLMWWNFPLMLDYGEALLLLCRLDDAGRVLDAVRTGLARTRETGQKTRSQIHQDGLRLADLERQLYEARNEDGTA